MGNFDTCIVSVAFREPYETHSVRQECFIETSKAETEYEALIGILPTKSGLKMGDIIPEFQKSLYGFKPHAIQRAINKGYTKVIWFDPSVLPITNVQVLIDSLDKHPLIVVKGDNPLSKMTNKKAKDWFGVTDKDIEGINHIGGTIYCFNFNNLKVLECFNLWKKAEEEGIFGNQDEFMAGHWADESCMALAMFKTGIEQYSEPSFKYLNQKEL